MSDPVPQVARLRDGRAEEAATLERLQRRAASVSAEDRAVLERYPEAVHVPADAIHERRLRVAADAQDQPVGFALLRPVAAGECELDGLFVEPDAFGQGLGRRLLEDAAARARAAGARRLFVVSGRSAQGFYERHGFELLDAVPTRFGLALQLQRRL